MAQIILDSANNLIQGDFDTATLSLRTRMQTSTTNATTGVYVVPNGSATSASVQVSNAADPTNASKVVVATNGATDTQIVSGANGSGSYLPLSFYTNNDIRFQMGNAGQLNVRTAPGTVSSGTSGQVLTSGGPAAGVSWTTIATGSPGIQATTFSSPGTFTVPASTTAVKVTVIGGGGGGSPGPSQGGGGGASGVNVTYITGITSGASIPVTVGTGGGAGATGNTSSIGPFGPGGTVSQTGGGAGSGTTGGTGSAGGGFGVGGANGTPGPSTGPVNAGPGASVGGNKLFLSTGGNGAPNATPGTSGTIGGGGGGGQSNFGLGAGSGGAGLIIVEY